MRKIAVPVLIAVVMALSSMIILPQETAYAEESEPECWAVIVGISDYGYAGMTENENSVNDAEMLYDSLRMVWSEDRMKLLLDGEAKKQDMVTALEWMVESANTHDTILFYYSGSVSTQAFYIAPYNARYKKTWLSASEMNEIFSSLKAKKAIMIADASNMSSGGTTFCEKLGGYGRVAFTANSEDDELIWMAQDRIDGKWHGIFTGYLTQALDSFIGGYGGYTPADRNLDRELSAEELFAYVESNVIADSSSWGSTQHPFMYDGYSGDIFSDDDSDEIPLLMEVTLSIPANLYYTDFEMAASIDGNTYSSFPAKIVSKPNTEHELQVPSLVDPTNGTKYVFDSWNDGNKSVKRTVTHGGEYTADYNIQYYLSVESRYRELEGEGWYDEGSMATFSAVSIDSIEEPATKHIFTSWSGDYSGENLVASLTMDSPKEVTANWRTEYLLTIDSAYGEPEGEGWYPKDSSTTIRVMPTSGLIIRKVFTGWSGDCSGENPVASLTMDSPKEVTANWRTDYTQLYILIGGSVGAAVAVILFIRRRRKTTK